ncbi:hypothetical protein EVAR_83232_1 [Eumeta japonica]|uniref:Uncharacterized protein n=1 Tax=Eumeta variegata TaxID=151549 RepID=A0A4C1Y4J9_EUMVA|nr:hypothetical protein EVAR_83232_1 [Eumeta japonica]
MFIKRRGFVFRARGRRVGASCYAGRYTRVPMVHSPPPSESIRPPLNIPFLTERPARHHDSYGVVSVRGRRLLPALWWQACSFVS